MKGLRKLRREDEGGFEGFEGENEEGRLAFEDFEGFEGFEGEDEAPFITEDPLREGSPILPGWRRASRRNFFLSLSRRVRLV